MVFKCVSFNLIMTCISAGQIIPGALINLLMNNTLDEVHGPVILCFDIHHNYHPNGDPMVRQDFEQSSRQHSEELARRTRNLMEEADSLAHDRDTDIPPKGDQLVPWSINTEGQSITTVADHSTFGLLFLPIFAHVLILYR
ncbi:hypothetical protein C8J56DRAFT_936728 [Mycena floridula]|nr:hypothetical protein C8J56DRAFT_936728 [Mycena floridula]